MEAPRKVTEALGIVSPQTLDRLWRERDPMARQRSSKPAFRKAVVGALSRGATLDAIELALKANDAQGDGTRCRDNNFAKGCCRALNGGLWEDFMEVDPEDEGPGKVLFTLGQLEKAVSALRRAGLRRGDGILGYVLTSDDRGLLGFAYGAGEDQVIGIPGTSA